MKTLLLAFFFGFSQAYGDQKHANLIEQLVITDYDRRDAKYGDLVFHFKLDIHFDFDLVDDSPVFEVDEVVVYDEAFDLDLEEELDWSGSIRQDAFDRVNAAADKLFLEGKKAWPELLEHCYDERESLPCCEVFPFSVGLQCLNILESQVLKLPKNYIKAKTRDAKNGTSVSTPGLHFFMDISLSEWIEKNKDKPIREIQIMALEIVLAQNDEAGYSDDDQKNEIRNLLLGKIDELKKLPALE